MNKTKSITKYILCTICIVAVVLLPGCAEKKVEESSKYHEEITDAIDVLESAWMQKYMDSDIKDKYLEIKNTRFIKIAETDVEPFNNVDYIVEFIVFDNYFDSAPYYSSSGLFNTVVVYKDGRSEAVQTSLFTLYRSRTFDGDVSKFIKHWEDLGETYNMVVIE